MLVLVVLVIRLLKHGLPTFKQDSASHHSDGLAVREHAAHACSYSTGPTQLPCLCTTMRLDARTRPRETAYLLQELQAVRLVLRAFDRVFPAIRLAPRAEIAASPPPFVSAPAPPCREHQHCGPVPGARALRAHASRWLRAVKGFLILTSLAGRP